MSDHPPPPPGAGSGALLPPDAGRDRPLFVVAAILVFLACLAALGARGSWVQAQAWTSDLETSLTIQVRPIDGRDARADAERAAEIARGFAEIDTAIARDREHAEALIAPWLGIDNLPDDLPLPLLVDVRLRADAIAPVEPLRTALDEAGLDANLDDHTRWSQAVRQSARAAQTLGLSLLGLLTAAAAAVIAFAARASLAARIDVIDALHLSGAQDRYIAALFQRRFFMLGLKAGSAGAIIAALIAVLVSLESAPADIAFFLPRWETQAVEISVIILAPLFAGLTSALSARLAVSTELRRRW